MVAQYVILGVYLIILIGIAIHSFRKTKTTNDFILGDRKIGAWMSAFAYGTTYFSAVMFVGYAGKFGWLMGVSATWIGIANAIVGTFLAWKLLAKPTRRVTQRLDTATMPDFFLKRYKSQGLKIVSAIIIFIFLVPYCASVYKGLSYFFESVFHIPYEYCMIGMAGFTALYLLMGGYIATAMTDFVQGLIMIGGVILMFVFIVTAPEVGGIAEGLARVGEIDPALVTAGGSENMVVLLVSLIILTSLGTWGLPQMVHKFYAIRDKKAITKGTVISTLFALLVGGVAYFVGTYGRLFLGNEVPEAGFDAIMPEMLTASLPPILLGLILVLILAASMSTLSSLVLVSSSSISLDLIKGVIKPKMKDRTAMVWMRSICAVFVLVSLVIALFEPSAIVTLMSYSWGALSGCFLAPFLLGVKWKGMTKAGAWAGIITGLVIVVPLMVLGAIGGILPGWMSPPAIGAAAMIISLIVTPIVSVMTKKYDEAHNAYVFGTAQPEEV